MWFKLETLTMANASTSGGHSSDMTNQRFKDGEKILYGPKHTKNQKFNTTSTSQDFRLKYEMYEAIIVTCK